MFPTSVEMYLNVNHLISPFKINHLKAIDINARSVRQRAVRHSFTATVSVVGKILELFAPNVGRPTAVTHGINRPKTADNFFEIPTRGQFSSQ